MISTEAKRTAEQLITELFDIIDNRRWDQLSRVFAEDSVYERPGYEPLVGLAAIQRFYRHERIVARGRHRVERVVSDLESVACWGQFTGEDRTGRLLDEAFADAYAVTAGKIKHRVTYFYRPAI